jgi:Uma2 family endonuclease
MCPRQVRHEHFRNVSLTVLCLSHNRRVLGISIRGFESARTYGLVQNKLFRIARTLLVAYCTAMLSSVLTRPEGVAAFADILRPETLPDGAEPEERMVISGISWSTYLDFDKALGDDRPGPRLYYLDGELEIMTTSNEHERIRKWIAGFLDIYFDGSDKVVMPRGQATMRILQKAGAEPEESWCVGEEKKFPDIVLEIALTSGGVRKLEIYHRFKVPEVWFWRRNKLEIFLLDPSEAYELARSSRLLPDLDISLIERCVAIRTWHEARQTFRKGL